MGYNGFLYFAMKSSTDLMDMIKFSLLYRSSFSGVFKLQKLVISKCEVLALVSVGLHL